jgi:hypothetical protein
MTYDGKPAAGARVFLYPEDEEFTPGLQPHGTVGEDGTYHITTYRRNDGAAPGKYKITVYWGRPTGRGDNEEMLPFTRYGSASSTPLSVQVNKGPTKLEPITLERD